MFDIGWSEMAVIALVALIVIGPKELPQALRAAAKWVRKARSLAREFQSGIDDMIREADLDDARKAIESTRNLELDTMVEDTVDPTGSVRDEANSIERAARDTGEERGGKPPAVTPEADDRPDQAAIVKSPVNVAPPHSVPPPREPGAEPAPDAADAAAGDDGAQKRA